MKLARAIHFDDSDKNVFHSPARTGEWCLSGGFEFSNWGEADLTGRGRQAFASGWLGVETFGRVTFVAVTQAQPAEVEAVITALARHFVEVYGAPSVAEASGVARDEVTHMSDLCAAHAPNTLLTVTRDLADDGVKEAFRAIEPPPAEIAQIAVHGDLGGDDA